MNRDENTNWRARFQLQEPLGEGGYGCVYLAKDLASGTKVAIKEVPLSGVDTGGWRHGTSVPIEASLLHKVQAVPGVIQLYECFVSDGKFYMTMELVPKATSLYDYMEKCGKLPLPQIKRLFSDIVITVQRCLNAGVSHKDIKPENVLLYEDPGSGEFKIKLIDFGCGEMIKGYRGTHTGGTSFYWPPEYIAKGEFLHVPLPQIKRLFSDIVITLQRCLKAGISHKDIKPENVLLYGDPGSGDFNIKLIDFGCGEMIKGYRGTHTGGTSFYWPPEYIAKGKFLHVPATVWSLGTLLYYLVCHDDPFYDDSEIENGRPPFPEDLPSQCRDLITKCFAMDPWERPTLHGILAHPWLKGFSRSEDGNELEPPDPKLFPPQIFRKLEERETKQNPQAPVNNTKCGLQEESEKESRTQKEAWGDHSPLS
ncbi:serine/threonine-protein kinase pim-3-like [Oratosquilla oratoria]|uniref:serine/threonine-protein kinase pim-3-like n=1 Tax=Oratosquilla oratoria TaxID=337810 RepID=UPI003F7688D1